MLWRAFDKTVRRKPLSFAVDAMGFQSTLVWKLLERRLLAGHPSNRSSSNSNHEGKAHDRLIVTRDRPFFKTPNLGISDVACFGHAIASAAKRLRSDALLLTNPINSRLVGNPECAGINRHVVGDERALQERRTATPSWTRVLQG